MRKLNIPCTKNPVDQAWLDTAYRVAINLSTDPHSQVGAILVDRNLGRMILGDANKFPRGIEETPSRWKRPTKYTYVVHAERNVLYHAAAIGMPTRGLWMYAPWLACSDCAQGIIQADIDALIGHKQLFEKTPARWRKSTMAGVKMLMEAGVRVTLVDCEIGGLEVRFNEEIWRP